MLTYPNHKPLAVIEAKKHKFPVGTGIQQGTRYAKDLQVPFVFSSNGDSFYLRDLFNGEEKKIDLDSFPSPDSLFNKYIQEANLSNNEITTN